jgi:O-antigen biosynthesis protein WbqP
VVKRIVDIVLASTLLIFGMIPICLVAIAVKLSSRGPILHWSRRVGRNNVLFLMPKFRTMREDAPQLATHLLHDAGRWITPIGAFLRVTSLDELPQLYSILIGQLSFVGPRPALFNQYDLVALRTEQGVHRLTPGLTGWAQINGRDELPNMLKAELDAWYLKHQSTPLDLKIIWLTAAKVLRREGVVEGSLACASSLTTANVRCSPRS